MRLEESTGEEDTDQVGWPGAAGVAGQPGPVRPIQGRVWRQAVGWVCVPVPDAVWLHQLCTRRLSPAP